MELSFAKEFIDYCKSNVHSPLGREIILASTTGFALVGIYIGTRNPISPLKMGIVSGLTCGCVGYLASTVSVACPLFVSLLGATYVINLCGSDE
jgi:hypothetical protein